MKTVNSKSQIPNTTTAADDTWLGKVEGEDLTVKKCRWLLDQGDSGDIQSKRKLAILLKGRLLSRYYEPHLSGGKFQKNHPGFILAACACLMIESLQRYRMEFLAESTLGHGGKLFKAFFSDSDDKIKCKEHKTTHTYLKARSDVFKNLGSSVQHPLDVYKDIRCGILHVGESRNGWRLWRYSYEDEQTTAKDPFDKTLAICDPSNRVIYADRFLVCVKDEVEIVCNAFAEGEEWDSFKKAMRETCEVCTPRYKDNSAIAC